MPGKTSTATDNNTVHNQILSQKKGGAHLKRKAKTVSLKWRIVLYLFIFAAIIISILWILQSVFLDDIYMDIKKRGLEKNCSFIVSKMSVDSFYEDTVELSKKEKTCIFVYNLKEDREIISCEGIEGRCDLHAIVYRMDFFEFKVNKKNINNLVKSAESNGGTILYNVNSRGIHADTIEFSTEFKRKDTEQGALLVKVITDNDGNKTAFMLNTVISPMKETVSTLNTILIYISLIIILLSVLFSLIISYLVTKPLAKMEKKAKELARGNYNISFEGGDFKEVRELAGTLNHASSQIYKFDRLKSELIANISHDLRTPITLISGYAEAMKDIPNEMTPENLQIIIDESNRMSELVNTVLDFSKLQSGNATFKMEPVSITDCIQAELLRYNKLIERDGYKIFFKYDRNITVKADLARITQVLYNLVNNAVVYTGNDKQVTVVQSVNESRVRISVIDSGVGIPKEHLADIWERYYKVSKNLNREKSGGGLGLAIVKAIIEAHHGVCGVDSTPGKGSCFFFELDIYE